jgi:hypothetical protein
LPKNGDYLQAAIDDMHKITEQQAKESLYRQQEVLQNLSVSTYYCINGKNPHSISRRDYIREFNKGPCAPTVFLPGIGGTKLRAMIDCNKFKSGHPTEFSKCFSSCSGWGSPKKEYNIWIPDLTGPMNLATGNAKKQSCWATIFGFRADYAR